MAVLHRQAGGILLMNEFKEVFGIVLYYSIEHLTNQKAYTANTVIIIDGQTTISIHQFMTQEIREHAGKIG
jgi:hypothetical protein